MHKQVTPILNENTNNHKTRTLHFKLTTSMAFISFLKRSLLLTRAVNLSMHCLPLFLVSVYNDTGTLIAK